MGSTVIESIQALDRSEAESNVDSIMATQGATRVGTPNVNGKKRHLSLPGTYEASS